MFSVAKETLQGVFHAHNWGQDFSEDLLETLIQEAKHNSNRKARLCLHPNPNEPLQVTYIAFSSPYSDRIHKHPHRPEVLVPIIGQAKHTTFDNAAIAVSKDYRWSSADRYFDSKGGLACDRGNNPQFCND